uniref:T-complex protein 11-like protein 1 n=2 Tax=Lygus hesperus TaxID=30085 RepID=A0A146LJJ9_LYGHE
MDAASSPSRESSSGQPPDYKENQRDDLMFKMFLAHELAMGGIMSDESKNPEDELASPDPLYNAVKQNMHDAFWNIFQEEINKDPPQYSMAFLLIQDIKESLFAVMTPNAVSVKNEVEEVLDVELMKQQLENQALDVNTYVQFIISVMSKICAPVRDEQLANLKKETDLVKMFRGILETLDLMKLDMVKFALTSIKPEILNNKMEYERKKFNDLVEVENGVLPNTELWLKRHIGETAESVEDVVFKALCDLLKWSPEDPYPETLFVDGPRLVMLKRDFYRLCISCSAVLLAFSCSPAEILADLNYKETLKSHAVILLNGINNDDTLKKIIPNLVEQFKTDANTKLAELNLPALTDTQSEAFQDQISQVADPENKVRTLVTSRIFNYLLASAKTPKEAVFPVALILFKTEIENVNSRFKYIANFNMNICKDYYYSTISKLRSE